MATISCGHCGGVHATVAEVRACARSGAHHAPSPVPGQAELPLAAGPGAGAEAPTRPASAPHLPAPRQALPPRADHFAGPEALGRGAVVAPGQPAPAPWADVPRYHLDLDAPAEAARTAQLLEALLGHGHRRERVVVELAGDGAPDRPPLVALHGDAWQHPATLLVHDELLHHLVWANAVDLRRPDQPRWAWAEAAVAAGATAGGPADVVLADGTPAWCDGGPLVRFGAGTLGEGVALVHRIALERGRTTPLGDGRPRADLAPDQLAAVAHGTGAARIIAPAGSGKTRVLTERARHLLRDWKVPADALCLVAFNERAAGEMRERTADLEGLQVRTLNALGFAILDGRAGFARRGGRYQVLDERAVRDVLATLVEVPRRLNTDPLAPWVEALSQVRLGLRSPAEVEEQYAGDVEGLGDVLVRYRAVLRERHALDFDEQIVGAIEALLAEPETRAAAQRRCRLLLVDEFQDLSPAHLLLVRLLASPDLACFGVGDDDQTIYGFSGATPEWLIRYDQLFPGAGDHPLEVNYRCPPAVVGAASTLLARNVRRVPKAIRAAPGRTAEPGALELVEADDTVAATADAVARALEAGAAPHEVAVLTRVNATLAAPQVVLAHRGIPVEAAVDERWLERTGVRAALAWLRLASRPEQLRAADVREAARRPPKGRSPKLVEWMSEQRSLDALGRLAGRLAERDGEKVLQFAGDLAALARTAASGTTAEVLAAVRRLGLDDTMSALDGFQRAPRQSGHLDDLDALIEVASLCPGPAAFPAWLHRALATPGSRDGVRLATVHKVKGREWPHVVLHDAGADQFPHRLAADVEEERRVFHVGLTRGSRTVAVVAPAERPSPFLAELRGATPLVRGRALPTAAPSGPKRADRGAKAAATDGEPAPPALVEALRSWRLERCRADGVPAYVVFHDATLDEIARRGPTSLTELGRIKGIGPGKLERYGADVLAVVDNAR